MEKKYQIFISSTYKDLVEERNAVTQAIIRKRHIPVGMEYFSASSLTQLEYIKKMLEFVDYYVLIIGGRYGSIDKETGKSFTHLEFEYAVERGIPILVFYPENPGEIPQVKLDDYSEGKDKLQEFISIAMTDRMSKAYSSPSDLKSEFSLSFDELIDDFPRTGWIKGDNDSNVELLIQLNKIRQENERLSSIIKKHSEEIHKEEFEIDNIINIDDVIEIEYNIEYNSYYDHQGFLSENHSTSISKLTFSFGDKIIDGFNKATLENYLTDHLRSEAFEIVSNQKDAMTTNGIDYSFNIFITNKTLMRLIVTLEVLKIIEVDSGYCTLTNYGKSIVIKNLVYKK